MVSAVVLAYNRVSEVLITIDNLKSLKATLPFDLEIIIVDNASVDNTSAIVKQKHPDVNLITKVKNNGVAGWNEGFKVASGKYFLVLDDDSHLHSGLTEAIQYLEANGDIGILALNIKDENLEGDPNLDPDEAWKDKQECVGFIGCGAIIRKDLYDKIGGYSEWVYVYTHEFDYSIRCYNAGYKVRFFENGIVVHRASKINRTSKRLMTFSARNEMGIVYKYFPSHRFTYLFRVFMNNMKFIKREGLTGGYYILLGAIKFIKMRKQLHYTPVSQAAQDFYANNFWSTQPVLGKLKKRLLGKAK